MIIETLEERLNNYLFMFDKEIMDEKVTSFYIRFMKPTFNKRKYREIFVYCQKIDGENIIKMSLNNAICGIVVEYDEKYRTKILVPETDIIRNFYYCMKLSHYLNKFDSMNFDVVNM